jgi:hypothetical protein
LTKKPENHSHGGVGGVRLSGGAAVEPPCSGDVGKTVIVGRRGNLPPPVEVVGDQADGRAGLGAKRIFRATNVRSGAPGKTASAGHIDREVVSAA